MSDPYRTPAERALSTAFLPFTDEQLAAFEARFGTITEPYTPEPKPVPRWRRASSGTSEPPFSLVFRPCLDFEWRAIQKQLSNEKLRHEAAYNLAMMTIVAVSLDGVHHIHGAMNDDRVAPNDRAASSAPKEALERITKRPGFAGVPDDVADYLATINGMHATLAEK